MGNGLIYCNVMREFISVLVNINTESMLKDIIWFLQKVTFKYGGHKSALIRENWLTAL